MKTIFGVEMNYTEKPLSLLNIGEAARRAKMSGQRFRRAVKLLKVPVYRSGWSVMIEEKQIAKILSEIKRGAIKPGRPKKEA
jgi:hypothetical protein